jgi:RecA-family ATPase
MNKSPGPVNIEDFKKRVIESDNREQAIMEDIQKALAAGDRDGALSIARKLAAALNTGRPIASVDAASWLKEDLPDVDPILEDTFDAGDKVAVIGSSKRKKSFFIQQMALCLASGKTFLTWTPKKPRRVYFVQFEVQKKHFQTRLKSLCRGLGISPADLGDRLQILNARGLGLTGPDGLDRIKEDLVNFKPEVIVLDPLYKISSGAENAAEDTKIILAAFDALAEETGAAVLYTHHDAKGIAGDRDIRDRGAGSNVIGRDYDACLTLDAHATNEGATVVEILLRNYRPQDAFSIVWTEENNGYCFQTDETIVPEKRTSRTKKPPFAAPDYIPQAEKILKDGRLEVRTFKQKFKSLTGLSDAHIREFMSWAISGGNPIIDTEEPRGRGKHEKWVFLARQV